LAASFAPAVEELDALLSSPGIEFASYLQQMQRQQQQQQQRSSRMQQLTTSDSQATNSDNESIDDEIQHVEASKLLL
jgi:hypothetical protein